MSRAIPKEQLRDLVGRPLQPFFAGGDDAAPSQNARGKNYCHEGGTNFPNSEFPIPNSHSVVGFLFSSLFFSPRTAARGIKHRLERE